VATQNSMDTMTLEIPPFFEHAELVFCFYFSIELCVRLAHERGAFLGSKWRWWNLFDMFLVFLALGELCMAELLDNDGGSNLTFLRMLRLLKMCRMVRIVRALRFFALLRIYLDQIFGSLLSLFWVFLILVCVLFIFSIAFMQETATYLIERGYPEKSGIVESTLHAWFKSVPIAMLSLFKAVAGGEDWGKMEAYLGEISLPTRVLFICLLFFTLMGILNVVTGLFCEEAAEMSRHDRDAVEKEEMRKLMAISREIRAIFLEVDADNSGFISAEEFENIRKNDDVMKFFG